MSHGQAPSDTAPHEDLWQSIDPTMPILSHGWHPCIVMYAMASLIAALSSLPLAERLAFAACVVERAEQDTGAPFTRHLSESCTDEERESYAVTSQELLTALNRGRGVDLVGVVLQGDLFLDELPLVDIATVRSPSSMLQSAIQSKNLQHIRVVTGPVSIQDSFVRGMMMTKLKDSLLVVQGPVDMTGTTFERTVDLSHTAFLAPVDFSDAILLSQGMFIRALFTQAARFERTAFGTHTRFHKATFAEDVTFLRAGFSGPAEFLEVVFEKDTSFSRTYFKMGVGFSGSRFRGTLDFSEATFQREAFFTFTIFERNAYFRRSTFRSTADFSDAEFRGADDFSKVLFDAQPRFARTKVSGQRPSPGGLHDARFLYAIAAAILIFTVVFVLVLRKN